MSTTRPAISVIILAYNEEQVIARCIESIINQAEPPEEIVVINNNSSDQTAYIARSYPSVRVVDEPKQGFIPARQKGFESARHELMVRCDADNIMLPGWLVAVRDLFEKQPQLAAASGPVYYHDAPIVRRLTFPFPGNQLYMRLVGCWPTLVGPNMVVTKTIWNKVKDEIHLDDKLVHEDMDLAIHIRRYGTIGYDKRLIVSTSARRLINRPQSLFFEYSWRNLRTLRVHGWPFGAGFYGRRRKQQQ